MRRMHAQLFILSVTLFLNFGAAPHAMAQQGSEITGTVSDPSGAAVPGTRVDVIQTTTHLTTSLM